MTSPETNALLARTYDVLRREGFSVKTETPGGQGYEWVVAENDLFVLAVVAVEGVEELAARESLAVSEMVLRLDEANMGGKRWDAYLVLLCGERARSGEQVAVAQAIERNTRGLRRLTSLGTETSDAGVKAALRPFLALRNGGEAVVSDPFAELMVELNVSGVDAGLAELAVSTFREKGHLNDV